MLWSCERYPCCEHHGADVAAAGDGVEFVEVFGLEPSEECGAVAVADGGGSNGLLCDEAGACEAGITASAAALTNAGSA